MFVADKGTVNICKYGNKCVALQDRRLFIVKLCLRTNKKNIIPCS